MVSQVGSGERPGAAISWVSPSTSVGAGRSSGSGYAGSGRYATDGMVRNTTMVTSEATIDAIRYVVVNHIVA